MTAFPYAELESKQITVLPMPGFERGLSAEVEHATVVAGEDDQRVVSQSVVFETRKNLTDDPVELVDEVTVKATLTRALKTLRRSKGVMDIGRRQIQKERFVFALLDPLDGILCERRSDLLIIEQLVSFLRSAECVRTAIRRLGRNRSDRRGVFRPPAEINQRITGSLPTTRSFST